MRSPRGSKNVIINDNSNVGLLVSPTPKTPMTIAAPPLTKSNLLWFGIGVIVTMTYMQLTSIASDINRIVMLSDSGVVHSGTHEILLDCIGNSCPQMSFGELQPDDLQRTSSNDVDNDDSYENDKNDADDTKSVESDPVYLTVSHNKQDTSTLSQHNSSLEYVWTDDRKLLYKYNPPSKRETLLANDNSIVDYCGTPGSNYNQYFTLDRKDRSGSNEDKTIYDLFFSEPNHFNNGTYYYVELGAFNGMSESNTRFFDVCLQWDGILIEANPKIYDTLVQNRPNAHRVSFAASCSYADEVTTNATIGFWQSWWANAVQDTTPNRAAYAENNQSEYVEVPCGSLTPVLLDIVPTAHIHFFSLDVEGAEPDVLQNIDFDGVFIDVFIVENTNTFCTEICESRDRVRAFMREKGYKRYSNIVTRSDLYIHHHSVYTEKIKSYKSNDIPANNTIPIAKQVISSNQWIKYKHRPPRKRTTEDITVADVCGEAPVYDTFFNLNSKSRSRLHEDKVIYDFFFKGIERDTMIKNNYHYVELGAFDGKEESNTRFYDVCLGWTGLLIEPNPVIFPRLLRNRPYSHRMSYAASCNQSEEDANTTVNFYPAPFTNAVQDNSPNSKVYAGKTDMKPVPVPCGSLTPVLVDIFQDNKRIHFFSLDTEGVEPMVVKNIDFNAIFIDVLIAENTNSLCMTDDCPSRKETREIMVHQNGYRLYTDIVRRSDLYVHPKSEFASKVRRQPYKLSG